MPESYVIEVAGDAAGIVVREPGDRWFLFHAAQRRFGRLDGLVVSGPREAERALRKFLAQRPATAIAGLPA